MSRIWKRTVQESDYYYYLKGMAEGRCGLMGRGQARELLSRIRATIRHCIEAVWKVVLRRPQG